MRTALLTSAVVALTCCVIPAAHSQGAGRFVVRSDGNPQMRLNELFPAYESYHSPRVIRLRERYGLDKVVAGETDELKRILLLRHWIATHIRIDDANPTPVREDAFAILDAALKGGGFHCAHFRIVQHAVLNSFGYVARTLGCGPGLPEEGRGGHHGVNEVWVNALGKWMIIDAKYDTHFEKDGVPLSALEIRDEVWKDGGQSVVLVGGPERKVLPATKEGQTERRCTTYRWCSWETITNHFTSYPAPLTSILVMLDDPVFRAGTWYRDGKPHWAYQTPYLVTTTRRDWIEWTPNVIASTVTVEGGRAGVALRSFTPNFKTYQVRAGDGEWKDCEDTLSLALEKRLNRFAFRAVSLFGITGPVHRVEIDWQAP